MDPPPPLTTFDDDQRTKALVRFALLQPHLEHGVTLDVLRRLNTDVERWGQVSLFLDALDMDNEGAGIARR